jgi:UPF0755 protein
MVYLKRLKLLVLLLLLLSLFLALFLYRYLEQPLTFSETNSTIEISSGSGFSQITAQLSQRDIISSPVIWTLYARLTGKATRVQAGEYQLVEGLTPASLLDKLVQGDVIKHHITLVEGWNFRQLLQALAANKNLQHRLLDVPLDRVMALLGKSGQHPEGRFFPDSYQFISGATDVDILQRAYQRLSLVLAQEWVQRSKGLPYKTAYEALILASIVEKETGLASEREEIAGVFVRRLQKGMRLQADPTVIYGLGENFQGNIRRRHLTQSTPYNTYVIRGLPPTPIAMVGREAIYAALHPKAAQSLYFVAKGDGSHFFSDTLEQHHQAVIRYQIQRRTEQYRSTVKPQ